ncbi:protease modulator HflC [Afifella sp. IM 167]|uniref:protease modulator HflC n=1 Tax=Afifella sp. IM 167 TaxID=2033586 RepID=UPI001CCB9F2D|nr:protease modulator HflC [Afifella sp. IM 167]MBZ8135228.1 protease modulator HflC [Afifella sp. IM 167]
MRRLWILLAVVVVVLFLVYSSVFVVNAREQALVLRFGEITRVIKEPGLYFKVPTNFVETVQIIEDRILSFEIEDIRVQVRDGRRYLVDAFVAYRIVEPTKFRENVSGSLEIAQQNLQTRLDASLRRVYGQRSFEAALSDQRIEMMRDVRDQLRPLAADLGIEIVDVRIKRTDLLPEVSQQTFDRMKAERLAEAAELRARGTQEAARIRAEADREAQVTVAEANRDSEVLRGEGDATRTNVFAKAFTIDPEFFEFYRSMLAYGRAIEGTGTTLVLKPDSEFFRYFRDAVPGGQLATPTGPAASTLPRIAPEVKAEPLPPLGGRDPNVQPGAPDPSEMQPPPPPVESNVPETGTPSEADTTGAQ